MNTKQYFAYHKVNRKFFDLDEVELDKRDIEIYEFSREVPVSSKLALQKEACRFHIVRFIIIWATIDPIIYFGADQLEHRTQPIIKTYACLTFGCKSRSQLF